MASAGRQQIVHGEVSVERRVEASPARAFQAFADAREREVWGAPTATAAFVVEREDFREGGVELIRCGDASDPQVRAESRYHRIVPGRAIVCTETVSNAGELAMVSLQTITFEADGDGTMVRVCVQLASFLGDEMISNTELGQNGSLDSLSRHLAGSRP